MSSASELPYIGDRWLPFSSDGFTPKRWLLLEGNRYSVILALLLFVFTTILGVGTVWTFEMQQLLTETSAVQSLLNTLLSGIILLVSIVVSISAIVLSYDITSLDAQEDRIDAALDFRRDIDRLTDVEESPTDPQTFLKLMTATIQKRAESLAEDSRQADDEFAEDLQDYTEGVMQTVESLDSSLDDHTRTQGDFTALWQGLEIDYGRHLNRSDRLTIVYEESFSETGRERFQELVRAFELFATGKEYFKTLYYTQEISKLSRVLLVISLPAILIIATATLAIEAHLLPDIWLFGLPPLLTFVSFVFTVSLAPFVVLTAYMIRVATVAKRTASAGPITI
ncbi:hypothetical protein [Haloarchaeobius amylolyticus]|uniref:hypothetical protein n=1 Tax=Haloarchaeobius amylolyticus TaxID=1198296 RepID=UPI00226D8DBF|nr:hypothetical protein [Haloarchaeobius amylolyticus]